MFGGVPGEEIREVRARIFERAKACGKVRPIFERFETLPSTDCCSRRAAVNAIS